MHFVVVDVETEKLKNRIGIGIGKEQKTLETKIELI